MPKTTRPRELSPATAKELRKRGRQPPYPVERAQLKYATGATRDGYRKPPNKT